MKIGFGRDFDYEIDSFVIWEGREYRVIDKICETWMGYKYKLEGFDKWVHGSFLTPATTTHTKTT